MRCVSNEAFLSTTSTTTTLYISDISARRKARLMMMLKNANDICWIIVVVVVVEHDMIAWKYRPSSDDVLKETRHMPGDDDGFNALAVVILNGLCAILRQKHKKNFKQLEPLGCFVIVLGLFGKELTTRTRGIRRCQSNTMPHVPGRQAK
ncbi:hypothetical protein BKA81DRAFT_368543 [Phyllosticta paracitricarpa]